MLGQAKFWRSRPSYKTELISSLPVDLGAYPVSAGYFTYYLQRNKRPSLLIVLFSLLMTLFELSFVGAGRVKYRNGWNIYWTFASYVLAYFLGFCYYKKLKKLNVL
ncbi:CBO0543 family protein [Alteribacter populi]|uniref:CBO0543 family protein n=1 Tax=Alteribacter populi TaxID=2011011 RepID=UPI003CCA6D5D